MTLIRSVAPVPSSRTKSSVSPFVSPATIAGEDASKAAKRPSALSMPCDAPVSTGRPGALTLTMAAGAEDAAAPNAASDTAPVTAVRSRFMRDLESCG